MLICLSVHYDFDATATDAGSGVASGLFFDILLFSAEDCLMSLLRRLDSCNSLPFSLGGWFSSPLCKSWSYMRWQCWLLGFGCLGSTAFFIMKIILADSCGSLWGLQLREPHWDRIPVIKRLQTKRGYKLATKRYQETQKIRDTPSICRCQGNGQASFSLRTFCG